MGKPAGRVGDTCSNHGPWHPSPITAGSPNVFTNGIPAARRGDSVAPHSKPRRPPHGRSIAAGSSNVSINGKPASRVGDAIACGGSVAAGSSNVFIGESPKMNKPSNASLPDITFSPQQGRSGKNKDLEHSPTIITPREMVEYEDLDPTDNPAIEPPEFKDAIVRIAIDPSNELYANDQFIIKSTDGSINITKTVADDLVPGDGFIDLQFTELDTSKNYTLEQVDSSSGDRYTYFEDFSYGSIGVQSPPAVEIDDTED